MTTIPTQACLTLDLENNWNFEDPELKYATFDYIDDYVDLVNSLDLPISVFVVGQTIEDRPDALEQIRDRLNAEFHLHSYSHDLTGQADLKREVRLGTKAFKSYFGRPPEGYRSTQGRISGDDFQVLESANFRFDSSVFPSYRPGQYNNLTAPLEPFRATGTDSLLEIPVAVVPHVRIPLSQSYIKAIGPFILKLLRHVQLPDVMIINTHLQDFYHTPAHEHLGPLKKHFYNRNIDNAETFFIKVVKILRNRNSSFVKMTDIYDTYAGVSGH